MAVFHSYISPPLAKIFASDVIIFNNEAQSPSVYADLMGDEPFGCSRHSSVSSTSAQLSKDVPAGIPEQRKFSSRERGYKSCT